MQQGHKIHRFENNEPIVESKTSKNTDMKFISGTCPHPTPGKYQFSFTSAAEQSIAESQKESLNNIDVLADGKEHYIRYVLQLFVH